MASDRITTWPETLQAVLDAGTGPLKRVTVLGETDSTQDTARRMHARTGDVIVAARQVRGRGRMGSAWADTSDQGIAMTFVLERESGERPAFVSAVATAMAAERVLGEAADIGIKWPNDIYAEGRKLAGILIEQHDELALIGIGMNVSQTDWPGDLASRAISLAQLGVDVARLTVLRKLLQAMNEVTTWPDPRLAEQFHHRHLLRDQTASFITRGETCTGRVVGLCMKRGLAVQTKQGTRWLCAAATRVVKTSGS